MESLVLVVLYILASGDAKEYTNFRYSKEWESYKRECEKEIPKYYSNMQSPRYRDMQKNKCARNKSRKYQETQI
jgi:hypothetical protein